MLRLIVLFIFLIFCCGSLGSGLLPSSSGNEWYSVVEIDKRTGESVTFECRSPSHSSVQATQAQWFKDGKLLDEAFYSDGRFVENKEELSLTNLELLRRDSGVYMCKMAYGSGSLSLAFLLYVRGPNYKSKEAIKEPLVTHEPSTNERKGDLKESYMATTAAAAPELNVTDITFAAGADVESSSTNPVTEPVDSLIEKILFTSNGFVWLYLLIIAIVIVATAWLTYCWRTGKLSFPVCCALKKKKEEANCEAQPEPCVVMLCSDEAMQMKGLHSSPCSGYALVPSAPPAYSE